MVTQWHCSQLTTKTKLYISIVPMELIFNSVEVVGKCERFLTEMSDLRDLYDF